MKYRVEVAQNGESLAVDVWHYVAAKDGGDKDQPWVLVDELRWENGKPE